MSLTGYNPEGGPSTTPLRFNQGLGRLERWDVDAMRRCRGTLTARALDPNVRRRLRLSLNRPFAKLDDPRGIAKNVASLEEVPYALGLIRQSLDRQLEEGA